MTEFKELLRTYEDLERQLRAIKQKIIAQTMVGNKRVSIDAEGITISERREPPISSPVITFTFDEIELIFKFLKEKGVLEG